MDYASSALTYQLVTTKRPMRNSKSLAPLLVPQPNRDPEFRKGTSAPSPKAATTDTGAHRA